MQNRFVTFEGIEGCGKSTQIQLLYDFLKNKKKPVCLTREPGGTVIADKIRNLLLDKDNTGMEPWTELFLYFAARAEHIKKVIEPKLAEGCWVLCDRYIDSTLAYQGYARGMDLPVMTRIQQDAGFMTPNITVLLDCPTEIGLERALLRRKSRQETVDRLEAEDIVFHQKVRNGFLALAKNNPKRFIVVDATQKVDALHQEIIFKLGLAT